MSFDLPEGAALLVAGHGVDDRPIHTLGSIGEALLATTARWRIKRMSPGAGERFGPNRAALKRMLDGMAGATTGVALFACAGAITGGDDPALVTGPDPHRYPDEDTLGLRWIADSLRAINAERLVVVLAATGSTGSPEAWLRAMRTDRDRDLIAIDGASRPADTLGALLAGLCGSALDPTTGTITLRSLGDHLARAVPGVALQRSEVTDTIASPPPLGLLWDVRAAASTRTLHDQPTPDADGKPDELIGVVLPGRFRIDAELARGSFGAVYRARQLTVDRDVAVKVVHAGIDPASDDGKLFVQEIQAVGRIDHRNVVRIYQADVTPDGRLFFAMELLPGRDLRAIGDAGAVPVARAVALVRELLAGLGAAHDAGLVHADVKPANALVVDGKDGERVVLVDFGLARLKPKDGAVESLGGTPAFMAPEQLRGERIDTRADVFSAALVLVTLVTGWRRKKAEELVPPLDAFTDPAVHTALARALAVDPADRFPTATDFADALAGKTPRGDATAITRAPFHHLASFTERDHGRLHGRDRDLALLVEHALYRRAAIYTAPSGTGKTSLLRAGLVPRLGTLGARPVYFSCRAGGEAALAAAIHPGATTIADAIAAQRNGRLVLILDQVETALETDGGDALIAAALGFDRWPADADVAVVLSVREDFLARLIGHRARIDEGVPIIRLGPLRPDGAREAIALPLGQARLTIAPELLDALLDDLQRAAAVVGAELGWGSTPAVYPPHLQLAGAALYEALGRGETVLTLAHYRKLGGLDAIVGEHLDRVLDRELDDTRARIARDVFLAVVTATHSRAVRPEAELLDAVGGHPREVVLDVLEALRTRGLMVRVRTSGGEPAWELVHDSLVPRILAWIDNRDLARRRAIELVRYHLRRSRADAPSLLGKQELREVKAHAAAIAELDREWAARPAEPWTPARLVAASRRARRRTLMLGATAVTLTLGIAAVAVTSWAIQRARAAREQSLRDRDVGKFTLELAPFDWDPMTRTPIDIAATDLPALSWRLVDPDPLDPDTPGTEITGARRGPTIVDGGGHLVQPVEARSGRAYLVIDGRGRGGERCAPSIVPLRRLPGYAQRERTEARFDIRIPTCQASMADTIGIPAGPFIRGGVGEPPSQLRAQWDPKEQTVDLPAFRIDRTEITNAAFTMFTAMAELTGIAAPEPIETDQLRAAKGPNYPVLALTYLDALAYCHFLGRELPSSEQWEKSMRGGLVIDGVANPHPRRNLPWGVEITPMPTRVKDTGSGPVPVGTVGDVSPYGVVDLAGNAQEWTTDVPDGANPRRVRNTRGGNWDLVDSKGLVDYISIDNARPAGDASYAIGARCIVPPATPSGSSGQLTSTGR